MKRSICSMLFLVFCAHFIQAQITAPIADGSDVTSYSVFAESDDIFIFCATDSLSQRASLTVNTQLQGSKNFLWEKYNEKIADFEFFLQESSEGNYSQINNLTDGCYRATVSQGGISEVDRAWAFNNWTEAEANISDSNCESFRLNGTFETAVLIYYDLSDNTVLTINKEVEVEWQVGGSSLASFLNTTVYEPPTENTDYTFVVFDKYGCEERSTITYESVVTKANFSADPMSGEGPLKVTFNNLSENGTQGYYEWHFYRSIEDIEEESGASTEPVDSIMFVAYDDNPVYTYENSGSYWVKVISRHVSETMTCVDTFKLPEFIVVDDSDIAIPNVFTPNGDGDNDNFIVMFQSMQSLEISIFNRWGRRVHHWKKNNIQGFEGTYTESVWDGKIGGRYASPGVYYYDVVGVGRDDKKHAKNGFVHLFRGKN